MKPNVLLFALGAAWISTTAIAQELTPNEARAIAKEAYIYGFPMVDNYRIMYAYAVDRNSPEFKAPFNQIRNIPRVFTPDDKAIQTPNSDTPYSFAWLDLQTEPMVLTLPAVEKNRYFSVQLIDLYTYNFEYLGSRTTGNGGGSFLIAGPGWQGQAPAGVKKVIRAETELVLAGYRTQLFNPGDLDRVKQIQAGYKVEPLSQFIGKQPPAAASVINFIPPLTPDEQRTSLSFFNVLAFVLQFCPTDPSEVALRERFAKLGIVPGKPFNTEGLSAEIREELLDGMAEGQKEIDARRAASKSSADMFGTREFLKNDYVIRAVGAQAGIYGNSKAEAFYVLYDRNTEGQPFDGSKNRYVLRFAPDQLPPVNAFWSLTMYDLPAQLLVANPLNRYLINSPMLPELKTATDGSLTLYIQKESPGKADEANWLPAPDGPFMLIMRLYWPKEAVLDGSWIAPALQRVN